MYIWLIHLKISSIALSVFSIIFIVIFASVVQPDFKANFSINLLPNLTIFN